MDESREKTLRRRSWLIATVTALFVLQAPLCALACANDTPNTQVTQNADSTASGALPGSTGRSCHEQRDADSSSAPPVGESGSHLDCGCDLAPQFVTSQSGELDTTPDPLFAVLARSLASTQYSANQGPPAFYGGDLPPPDVLLLKSTLIL